MRYMLIDMLQMYCHSKISTNQFDSGQTKRF